MQKQFASVWANFMYSLFTPIGAKSKDKDLLKSSCSTFLINILQASGSKRKLVELLNSFSIILFKDDLKILKEIYEEFFKDSNGSKNNQKERDALNLVILQTVKPSFKYHLFISYLNYCLRNFGRIHEISGSCLWLPPDHRYLVCNIKIGNIWINDCSFHYNEEEDILLFHFLMEPNSFNMYFMHLLEKSQNAFVYCPDNRFPRIIYKIMVPKGKMDELVYFGVHEYVGSLKSSTYDYLAHQNNFYPFIIGELESQLNESVEILNC